MKSKTIPICLLVLVLGCTGIPGLGNMPNIASSSDPGVMITKFYADQEILKPSEMTELTAQVTNAGGHRAENVEAMLFRLGGISTPENLKSYSFGALEPADPTSKTPAETKEHKWRVTAPAPASVSKREGYNIGLQLKYDYTSDGWADLVATTKEGAKTTETAGGSGSSVGPIGVAVFAPPILLYDDTTEGRLATVRVDLVNMASGYLSCTKAPEKVIDGKKVKQEVNRLCSVQIRVPAGFLALDGTTGAVYKKETTTANQNEQSAPPIQPGDSTGVICTQGVCVPTCTQLLGCLPCIPPVICTSPLPETTSQPDGSEATPGGQETITLTPPNGEPTTPTNWYCKPMPKDEVGLKEIQSDPTLLMEYVWKYEKTPEGDIILTKDISDPGQADVLELMRGQEKSFVCTFRVKDIGPQQVIPIRAEAKYTYATEAALLLQVTG